MTDTDRRVALEEALKDIGVEVDQEGEVLIQNFYPYLEEAWTQATGIGDKCTTAEKGTWLEVAEKLKHLRDRVPSLDLLP